MLAHSDVQAGVAQAQDASSQRAVDTGSETQHLSRKLSALQHSPVSGFSISEVRLYQSQHQTQAQP